MIKGGEESAEIMQILHVQYEKQCLENGVVVSEGRVGVGSESE